MQPAQATAPKPTLVKPATVGMRIHVGMLESLGINMYTTIGKSLVEFIANSFDADATEVSVSIPFPAIEKARNEIREKAKKEFEEGKRDSFQNIYECLPEDIAIVIDDNGHGMSVEQIQDKYLIINRNKRKADGDKSENGTRFVMGRKGLGKLAGFGTAEEVIVRTKRKGETYATTIVMNFNKIKEKEEIGEVVFDTKYEENLSVDEFGTTITLKNLRCDSLKSKEDSVQSIIARNFFFTGEDFKILLNGTKVEPPEVEYEFIYPPENERTKNGLAEVSVKVYEGFEYPILYAVKFRARGKSTDDKERGSLPAYLRGARVYCNQRLAAGPTLFNLGTGMHNFHAQDYMECIVEADVLDQKETDLISTNRSDLKTDNEVIDAFMQVVTDLMKKAIYEHSKFRDKAVEEQIQKDPVSLAVLNAVAQVPEKNREPAKKILKTLALSEGIESTTYQEVAPLFIRAINSSEILIELIKTGINPEDLKTIIGQLTELAGMERSDVLKLYRGRRHGIEGLQKLEERSHDTTHEAKYEDELQALLKGSPWLIKAEYNNYLTSDKSMAEVARKLTEKLQIDKSAENVDKSKDQRPDLVFVMTDSNAPTTISVVELKSPNIPLNNDHLSQLETYMMNVEAIIQNDYQGQAKVTGHLIGNFGRPDTQSQGSKLLMKKIQDAGPSTPWEVLTLPMLLDRARKTHQSVIASLEAEEAEEAKENEGTPKTAS